MPSNRTAQTGSSSNIARVPQRQLARRNLEARLFGLANAPDKFLPCASCLRDLSTLASVRDVPRRVLPRTSASVSAEDVFSLGPARLRQAGFRDCSLSATTAESFPRPVSGVNTEPPRFLVYPNLFWLKAHVLRLAPKMDLGNRQWRADFHRQMCRACGQIRDLSIPGSRASGTALLARTDQSNSDWSRVRAFPILGHRRVLVEQRIITRAESRAEIRPEHFDVILKSKPTPHLSVGSKPSRWALKRSAISTDSASWIGSRNRSFQKLNPFDPFQLLVGSDFPPPLKCTLEALKLLISARTLPAFAGPFQPKISSFSARVHTFLRRYKSFKS